MPPRSPSKRRDLVYDVKAVLNGEANEIVSLARRLSSADVR
jgi:hypothetical protein